MNVDGSHKVLLDIGHKPNEDDGWDVLSVNPLTLSPSLLCKACGHHGFIRQGRWVPA